MKVLLAVVILAFVASVQGLTDEQKLKVQNYKEDCYKVSGATKEVMKQVYTGDFTTVDEKSKDFIYCFFKHTGFQTETGELQLDVIKAKVGAEIGKDAIELVLQNCVKKYDTPKETAYNLYKCYYEKSPTHAVIFS